MTQKIVIFWIFVVVTNQNGTNGDGDGASALLANG